MTPLRLLLLEDDVNDADLLLEQLRLGGMELETRRVESAMSYEAALHDWQPDLIISDYNLPGYDGHSALQARQRLCPQVPFLFVSGTIGEERAIAALKEGATDYLLKDRPQRLLPAVNRALAEARERAALERAEAHMRLSEARFRALVENSSDVFWETDEAGRFTYLSPNAEQAFGWPADQLLGRTPFDLMPPDEALRLGRLVEPYVEERRPFALLSHTVVRKDGSRRLIECSGKPSFDVAGRFRGFHGVDRDITERKRLEDELRQTEKMASVGLLIGGVAHELNNPLMGILGHAQLLLADAAEGSSLREDVAVIEREAKRCKRLIKSLLAFARREPHQFQPADLNALVEEMVELKSYDLKRANVELLLELEARLPVVRVDPNQIQQVLLNLMNNAVQAMEGRKGRLRVATRVQGGAVELCVSDSGPGIPPELLPRIFEPFFTTKEAGKGTGLGLSICMEIAKEHGGELMVDSPPGEGATFRFRLPTQPATALLPRGGEGARRPGEGKRRTLVVDDDEMVLKFVARALRQEGFEVEAHSVVFDGLDAVKRTEFDLVLFDFHMPGLNGAEFFRRASAARPGSAARYILFTGENHLDAARGFAAEAGVQILLTPFDLEEFRRIVGAARRGG